MIHQKHKLQLSLFNLFSRQSLVLTSLLAVLFMPQTFAATDGILARQTEGQIDISLRILDTTHFSIEVDFDQEKLSANGDIIRDIETCISFNGSNSYSIIATTNTEGFILKKPADDTDIHVTANVGADDSVKADVAAKTRAKLHVNTDVNAGMKNSGVAFLAYWSQSSRKKDRTPLQYGIPFSGRILDQAETEKCVSGKGRGNSRFSILIPKNSKAKVRTGRYRATISLVISPN